MENKRTADKVRMLRKINANYNRSTIINPVDENGFRMEKDLINKYRSFGLFVRFIVQIGGKIVNLTNYVIYN